MGEACSRIASSRWLPINGWQERGRENGKKTRGKRISSKGVGKETFKLRRIREITLGNSNEKGEKNEERKSSLYKRD